MKGIKIYAKLKTTIKQELFDYNHNLMKGHHLFSCYILRTKLKCWYLFLCNIWIFRLKFPFWVLLSRIIGGGGEINIHAIIGYRYIYTILWLCVLRIKLYIISECDFNAKYIALFGFDFIISISPHAIFRWNFFHFEWVQKYIQFSADLRIICNQIHFMMEFWLQYF